MTLEMVLHLSKTLGCLSHPAVLPAEGRQPSGNFWPGLDPWQKCQPEHPGDPSSSFPQWLSQLETISERTSPSMGTYHFP